MPTFSNFATIQPSTHGLHKRAVKPDRRKKNELPSGFAHYLARPILRLAPIAFAAGVAVTIAVAWVNRTEGHLTAESGIGYWLGVAGAVIMLMLVGYPMRKRFRFLARFGRVANWFRLHMVLGIVGPTLVILHTNFKLGSLNSRLALVTMLIVVASGVAGRYLYAKIHKGLYGKQIELREVLDDISVVRDWLGEDTAYAGIVQELEGYGAKIPSEKPLSAGFVDAVLAGAHARASRRRVLRRTKQYLSNVDARYRLPRRERRRQLRDIDGHLKILFAAAKKAARLAFFEKVFGLWHHLHMPLFVLLTLTVVMHVIAVHLY